jgi:hypothetical protein
VTGCDRLLPVDAGCEGEQPGQIRGKSILSRGELSVILCVLKAACVTATAAGGGCSGTQQTGRRVACIYARYSTRFQDSVDDQVREYRKSAEQNVYSGDPDLIFADRGKSGRLRRRPSRMAIQAALEKGRFDVLVVLVQVFCGHQTHWFARSPAGASGRDLKSSLRFVGSQFSGSIWLFCGTRVV